MRISARLVAALFAFRSPLSKGALLADEVGLGKTIEAEAAKLEGWADDLKVGFCGDGASRWLTG